MGEFEEKSNAFVTWLSQHGAWTSGKVSLEDLRRRFAGRGVVAQEGIAEEEDLFTIPRASILTTSTSSLPPDVRSKCRDPWLSLTLAMIYEYQQGTNSIWKPYLDVLPADFDTPIFWTETELEQLTGSAMVDKIGKVSADEAFEQNILPVIRQHADAFKASTLDDKEILSLCHRMGSTIMAYAFDLEGTGSEEADGQRDTEDGWEEDRDGVDDALPKGMVPLADMLNADADRNNAKLFYEGDSMVMRSIKPIAKGEEILNDYGPLPRADVLRRYGYVTRHYAKYDVVEIGRDLIVSVAKESSTVPGKDVESRLEYLEEQGVLDDAYDIARADSEDGQFSVELCMLINALTMPAADFDRLRSKEKLPTPDLSGVSLEVLHVVLLRRMTCYGDRGLEQDQRDLEAASSTADMQSSQSARRRYLALQVIVGEKEVLQGAIDDVQWRMLHDGKKRSATDVETDTSPSEPNGKRRKI